MAWTIEYTATAKTQLRKLDRQAALRIVDYMDSRVAELDDPRALGNVLTGPLEGLWRYRVGNCRVLCEIEDRVLRVLVVRIGHRRAVYR